jgi:hypothetical protein
METIRFSHISFPGRRVYEADSIVDMITFAKMFNGEYLGYKGRFYCIL